VCVGGGVVVVGRGRTCWPDARPTTERQGLTAVCSLSVCPCSVRDNELCEDGAKSYVSWHLGF
jgi:hypothetical protein